MCKGGGGDISGGGVLEEERDARPLRMEKHHLSNTHGTKEVVQEAALARANKTTVEHPAGDYNHRTPSHQDGLLAQGFHSWLICGFVSTLAIRVCGTLNLWIWCATTS